jgi:hypothetical protein
VYPRLAQQSDQDFDVLRDRIFGVAREASRIYLSLDFEDAQDRFAGFCRNTAFQNAIQMNLATIVVGSDFGRSNQKARALQGRDHSQ